MKDSTKKILLGIGAFLFAAAIVITVSITSKNTILKASEEAVVGTVQEKADSAPEVAEKKEEAAKEIPKEQPAEEPAEQEDKQTSIEEIQLSEIEEEPEKAFDLKEAYEYYISLRENEREAYLESLSPENRNELVEYIKKMQAAAETAAETEDAEKAEAENTEREQPAAEEQLESKSKKTADFSKMKVSFTSDHAGKDTKPGDTVHLKAKLEGFEGLNYTVYWEYSKDGGKTFQIDGKGMTHTVIADEKNDGWIWRVNVLLNK